MNNVNKQISIQYIDWDKSKDNVGLLISKCGYTNKDIAAICELSPAAVSQWRHAKSVPNIENLYILSQLLGLSINEILIGKNIIINK